MGMVANFDGRRISDLLEVEIIRRYPAGEDGTCFLLADGRILKVTASQQEAAVMLAVMQAQDEAGGHPCVPAVHGVYWDRQGDGRVIYAILRDEMPNISVDNDRLEDFILALEDVCWGWLDQDGPLIHQAVEEWQGPELTDLLDGLEWIEERTGIRVNDIKYDNLGLTREGKAGMRDMGRAEVPPHLLERVQDLDFESLSHRSVTPMM